MLDSFTIGTFALIATVVDFGDLHSDCAVEYSEMNAGLLRGLIEKVLDYRLCIFVFNSQRNVNKVKSVDLFSVCT